MLNPPAGEAGPPTVTSSRRPTTKEYKAPRSQAINAAERAFVTGQLMVIDYAARGEIVLTNIPPPEDIKQFWQLFLMWSNNFERSRAEEVRTISESVTRLVDGAKSLDGRVDRLESLADQVLPRVPDMVEEHDREIQALKTWKDTVDTPPGILHRMTQQNEELNAIKNWRTMDRAIVAAVSTTITVLGGIIAVASGYVHLGGHP